MDDQNITQFDVILANFHKLLLLLGALKKNLQSGYFRCILHKNDIKKLKYNLKHTKQNLDCPVSP